MSTNAVVDWFWLDNKVQKCGTYGATGSGADYIDDNLFTGVYKLMVKKGGSGLTILVR